MTLSSASIVFLVFFALYISMRNDEQFNTKAYEVESNVLGVHPRDTEAIKVSGFFWNSPKPFLVIPANLPSRNGGLLSVLWLLSPAGLYRCMA